MTSKTQLKYVFKTNIKPSNLILHVRTEENEWESVHPTFSITVIKNSSKTRYKIM